jgi:hypothetical protein
MLEKIYLMTMILVVVKKEELVKPLRKEPKPLRKEKQFGAESVVGKVI